VRVTAEGSLQRSACALGKSRKRSEILRMRSLLAEMVFLDGINVSGGGLALSRTEVSECDGELYARLLRITRLNMLADGRSEMEVATEMRKSREKNDGVALERMRFLYQCLEVRVGRPGVGYGKSKLRRAKFRFNLLFTTT
jgi:hypothetical protein